MAFAGTTQKCMACTKTVYLVDKLTADNRIFHKACFRCHHCKGTLKVLLSYVSYNSLLVYSTLLLLDLRFAISYFKKKHVKLLIFADELMYIQLSNYNSFEGVLYCKPHFDQLFKRTGSLEKSFEGITKRIINN